MSRPKLTRGNISLQKYRYHDQKYGIHKGKTIHTKIGIASYRPVHMLKTSRPIVNNCFPEEPLFSTLGNQSVFPPPEKQEALSDGAGE